MAIGRISGPMLFDNLVRQGADLRFEGNLLYLDVNNLRLGINIEPDTDFHVRGESLLGNIRLINSTISSTSGPLDLGSPANITIGGGSVDYVLTTNGSGTIRWSDVGSLAQSTGTTGMNVVLGTPSDASLINNSSWDGWTSNVYVTDAIDDLNQVALNIAKDTYVGALDFTANVVAGPSPTTVEFTGTYVGNPTNYYWDFGDGNTSTAGSTVTHVYENNDGDQYTVTFRAYNINGTLAGNINAGARGSYDDTIKNNYITLYTPTPIPDLYVSSDEIDSGQGILIGDDSLYASSYEIIWGDGDTLTPDPAWTTESHTYVNSAGDTVYFLQLVTTSNTAGPTPVTVAGDLTPIRVYSTHVPAFGANVTRVINEAATNGGVVSFTNTTATDPGDTAVFGSNNFYRWDWEDSLQDVNIGSGIPGNPGTDITHTFALDTADQIAGNTVSYQVGLSVYNNHSMSPFLSSPTTIIVEPDVRSEFSAVASTVSDRVGDSSLTGYVYTDYFGRDRSQIEFTSQAQNASIYQWAWGDGNTSANIAEGQNGSTTGNAITHSYSTVGSKSVVLSVYGTPGTIAQSDVKTRANYVTIAANPSAPGNLSTKTLTMDTASSGTSPLIAANATDNTSGNLATAGTSVTRYTGTSAVSTNVITNANTSVSGTLTAMVNGSGDGNVSFSTTTNSSGTYTSLVVSSDSDAHDAISSTIYPTGFYKVFDAKVTKLLSSIPAGYNQFGLLHSVAGNTNLAGFVKDDLLLAPSLDISAVTMSEYLAGTQRYISGIPYYNTGGQVLVEGVKIYDWIGQTYLNGYPITVQDGPNLESTSQPVIATQNKTYQDIDGSTTFLINDVPEADTGKTSATKYSIGDIVVNINATAAAVGKIDLVARNVNGTSTTYTLPTPINVYSSAIVGINEESIPVSSSLGATYSDVGKRVVLPNSSATDATPAFNSSVNYYTGEQWTGAETIAGTHEAVTRWGVIKNVTTDFSSYLPPGPDLATGRTGYQYFTFAFRRTSVANFDININGKISGLWIAAPGTLIDSTSSLNGWLDSNVNYAGSGIPGSNTAAGGNGSNGCALRSSDRIPVGTVISDSYTMSLGGENLSNATGKVCLVRLQLASTDYVNSISIGVAA